MQEAKPLGQAPNPCSTDFQTDARGFSLIEAMVAIVVISIGLLGLVGLESAAVRNAYASYQRSLANLQAQDAVERLWAARCALRGGSVLSTVRSEWQAAHAAANNKVSMPGWSGNITGTENVSHPIASYTITISWTERSTQQGVAGTSLTYGHDVHIPLVNCS